MARSDISTTVVPFQAGDGYACNLLHLKGSNAPTKGPVVLVHGAGVRANLFRPPTDVTLPEMLIDEGYDVWLAANGADAIQLLEERRESPCAVLVDLLMPGIVGQELLEYLRHDDGLRRIPVAIVSASPQLAPEGYRVFKKPLDVPPLLDFLRHVAA